MYLGIVGCTPIAARDERYHHRFPEHPHPSLHLPYQLKSQTWHNLPIPLSVLFGQAISHKVALFSHIHLLISRNQCKPAMQCKKQMMLHQAMDASIGNTDNIISSLEIDFHIHLILQLTTETHWMHWWQWLYISKAALKFQLQRKRSWMILFAWWIKEPNNGLNGDFTCN